MSTSNATHRAQRTRAVADVCIVTPPRQIIPGQLCFVTVRAVNRTYRFVPNSRVLRIIWYCLAIALDKYRGKVIAHDFLWMSNHYHMVLTDQTGCLPAFMGDLNSLLARALNALHGAQGTVVEKGYNLVAVMTADKAIEHCVYTLTNPCSAHLVERSQQWRGVSSLSLEYGRPILVERPGDGLWRGRCRHVETPASRRSKRAVYGGRSKLPEQVELVLTRPPIMLELSDDELRRHIRERLDDREQELIEARRANRQRVMGWKAAARVSFRAAPVPTEERFGTVPSYSAGTTAARLSAWRRRREFLDQYYGALRRFLGGEWTVAFPVGTWLMKRRFGVVCCPLPAT